MPESWMKWAVAEGGAKSATRLINKTVGSAAGSFGGSLVVPAVVGAIEAFGGLIGAKSRGKNIVAAPRQIFMALLFGMIAAVMSFLSVFTFTYTGADVGITTFIITMSIIPGAFIDWAFFKHPFGFRESVGIGVFLLAGYSILNFPELKTFLVLPAWILITLVIMLLAAVNESITRWQGRRKIEPLDQMVNNFWIGLAMMFSTGIALMLFRPWSAVAELPLRFWFGSFAVGLIVLAMHSFKLLAYKGGGSIALKKLIMQSTYLVLAVVFGWLIYAEPLTIGKFLGMIGFTAAFILMDKGTWEFVVKSLALCQKRGGV